MAYESTYKSLILGMWFLRVGVRAMSSLATTQVKQISRRELYGPILLPRQDDSQLLHTFISRITIASVFPDSSQDVEKQIGMSSSTGVLCLCHAMQGI